MTVEQLLLAPNPGPMTLDGTNTWVLRAEGAAGAVVIDPGPLHEEHLQAVASAAGHVDLVLVTHHHLDHTEGVPRFVELTGAPVRAFLPDQCHAAEPLRDGEELEAGGLVLQALHTPGHSSDSLTFVLPGAVLTGDTVLGRGTTVVAHPDGVLGDYLGSLRRLAALTPDRPVWPGHGPRLPSVQQAAASYLAHRESRLDQVRAAVAAGAGSPREVVEVVYADVDVALWPAAELSVRAQLAYLDRA